MPCGETGRIKCRLYAYKAQKTGWVTVFFGFFLKKDGNRTGIGLRGVLLRIKLGRVFLLALNLYGYHN